MSKKVILSGIQPSGALHLGNYFGAMKQHIALQDQGEAFYFLANYHALTTLQDGEVLRAYTRDVVLDYLALGLDPEVCTLFAQSDVPQTTELAWILGCLTPVSLMEKGVSYKDKISQGLSPNIGLFTYPILQAADILIYHSDIVPVGEDQKQNIEIARDLANKFNHVFKGEYLKLPEEMIVESVSIVPGIDGRKMSKSYQNTIPIFEEGSSLKKRIGAIQTDSTPLEEPKNPDTCTVFALIKLFASEEESKQIASHYRAGGFGYGHAKQKLMELMDRELGEAREKRKKLSEKPGLVDEILAEGGRKARQKAESVMSVVREVTGLSRSVR